MVDGGRVEFERVYFELLAIKENISLIIKMSQYFNPNQSLTLNNFLIHINI